MQEQEQIRGPRQILQKLRSFGMAFYEDKQADTRGLRYLIAFCQLKSVKQLNFSTSISSLERIAFPYLPIGDYSSPQWVYRFIRCFPYLHSLSYVHHPAVMPSRRLELLVRAAAHLKSHLRELHLPPSVCCFCPYGHMRKIESLAHFEQLKIINVTAFDLWVLLPPRELASVLQPNSSVVVPLVRLLPCSLEELILQEGNTNTILHVWGLLEDLKAEHSRVPLLKYIRIIKSQHLIIREHWKTISYLKDLALKHNIILTVETRREAGLPPLPKWLPEYDCRDEYHLQQVNTILQEYLDQR
ncbi:uncharacterized protein LY89DRAFT_691317 [Mollisia scopiformis]|uniref:Uncharacterized protein n=1 Tax=Mollisia scopiformis TaxID=149040 RepID=A0A132B6H2_MOLSC|nr:uncharacterized protein LY89DRAFT_691317 [Mollisia scopiformis]KUJ08008.1 hypothetical protein LY89DRAFT_691317 [Mollisia scopiformis]